MPFVAIRKKGKLPGECWNVGYTTEYSDDIIEIQKDAFPAGSKALIVDDLLATGGTLRAAEQLIENIPDASISAHVCVFDIHVLNGYAKLTKPCHCLISLGKPKK